MKNFYKYLSTIFFFCNTVLHAQFNVTNNGNATNLAQKLSGPGVVISNAILNCPGTATGSFSNAPNSLGIDSGIILSTGNALDIESVAGSTTFIDTDFMSAGDFDLDTLLSSLGETYTTFDACALEFDIVVTGDSLNFNYVMGSEEYPDFVCGFVNDIFGFYITGPNPAGGNYVNQNIALIPGTVNTPVSINTVNNGTTTAVSNTCFNATFSNLMNQNTNPISAVDSIAFNQLTATLSAGTPTIPCQQYHFKLVIADGGDRFFDSAVFLEAGSFTSTGVLIGSSSTLGDGFTELVEGCVDGIFTLEIDTPSSFPRMVGYTISGTAINGVDYNLISDSVLIPAGDSSVIITITPITDNISEGLETIILTPYTNCGTLGTPASLNLLDLPPIAVDVSDSILCAPSIIELSATGGIEYHWSDSLLLQTPDSSHSFSIAPIIQNTTFYLNGFYGNCAYSDSVVVLVSNTNPVFETSPISCPGLANGELWAVINPGANYPLTYQWVFAQSLTDSIQIDIGPGFQLLTITDDLGCDFTSGIVNFTDPAAFTFDFDSTDISCQGANDGELNLFGVDNGSYTATIDTNGAVFGNYTFTIDNDTFSVTGLGPNVYDFSFTNDTTGCSESFTASLSDPSGLSFDFYSRDYSCNNANDGEICIYNITAGNYVAELSLNSGPATLYNFTMNNDTFCISSLTAGNYDVLIRSTANTCNGSFTTTISSPQELDINLASIGVGLCAGDLIDSIVSTTTGGTAPYSYLWSNNATTPNLIDINFNTYSVIVSDSNNCLDSTELSLIEPQPIVLTSMQDSILCFGGSNGLAYLENINGGTPPYSYSWSDGQTTDTAFNLIAGQYTIIATDNNGCMDSSLVSVTQPATAISISLSTEMISCFGGDTCIEATVANGSGPYTYAWNDPAAQTTEDICNVIAGTYTLIVTDANNCTISDSIAVTEVPEIVLMLDSANISCFATNDGSATVLASGGSGVYNYLWNDAAAQTTATASNLAPGVYTVIVSDATDASCFQSASLSISEPDSLIARLNNLQDVLCNGAATGAIDVDIIGGVSPYNYSWSNTSVSEDIIDVEANSYTLTVMDANNCTAQFTDIISQPPPLSINEDNLVDVGCFGDNTGAIDISVTGGLAPYAYSWDNLATSEDLIDLVQGSYTVTVIDANNCDLTRTFEIDEPADVNISFAYSDFNGFNISCNGLNEGSIEAIVNGGNPPYTYSWDNGSVDNPLTGLEADIVYTVTVSDDLGCTYVQDAIALTEPEEITIIEDSTAISCSGFTDGVASLIVSGGNPPYTYLWSDPTAQTTSTATGLAAGSYTCNITDANACTRVVQIVIEDPQPIFIIARADSVNCWGEANGALTIEANGGNGDAFEYSIDNGASFQTSNTFSNLPAGVYNELIVRQGGENGCSTTPISLSIQQPEPLFIFINPEDILVSLQEEVILNIEVDPATGYYEGTNYSVDDINTITWSPTQGLSCTDCLNPTSLVYNETSYTASVLYSPYNCKASAQATIRVENNLNLFIPNSFSPNGDNVNDVHYVYGEGLKYFNMQIYNRWGEKVFQSNVQTNGWDGIYKGELVNPGVYTYVFKARYLDDKEIDLKGSITVLK